MSFSYDIKEELARVQPVCSHCNRALLAGYARLSGALHMKGLHMGSEHMGGAGVFSLEISSDIALVARTLTQILHDEYHLQTEITMRRSVLHKNVNYLIDVPAQPTLMKILCDLGFFDKPEKSATVSQTESLIQARSSASNNEDAIQENESENKSESEITGSAHNTQENESTASVSKNNALQNLSVSFTQGVAPHLTSKACCASAYIRGAFLASGFVSDPKSNAHFEMTLEDEILAHDISQILSKNQIPARVKARRGGYVVYLKSGEHIVNFLSFSGAHACAIKYEEARVMKSVRSGVNRQINAELANQKRAAVAAVDQVFAARAIIEHYGAGKLTPALQEFIRLRIKYPNASLKELGQCASPPLSKSAVAHRVRRMMQLAREIEKEE